MRERVPDRSALAKDGAGPVDSAAMTTNENAAPGGGPGGSNGNGADAGIPDSIVEYVYRIFCAREPMPPLEKLLARLTSGNPHNPPGSFIFPPGRGMRRLQDALGASADYFVMGYTKEEAHDLWRDLATAEKAGQARWFTDEDRTIVAESKLCVVVKATIKNPQNNEFVETLVHLADAFRDLLQGVVQDVHMEKVFGHAEWREHMMTEPFSVLNHVTVRVLPSGDGESGRRVVTRGLKKFGSPDLAVLSVPEGLELEVQNVLRDFAEHMTQGELLSPDELIEYPAGRIRVIAHPPLAKGENDLLALVDENEAEGATFDAKKGAPKVFQGLEKMRTDLEGKRAEGGKGAQ